MRTIRLEILRHGPPHNQLLSPLTEYLALCENHQAVTVELAFEHAEFMQRLSNLRYGRGTEDIRPLAIEDMAGRMSRILAQVPGLIRELAEQTAYAADATADGSPAPGKALFHLRLILSANELALLPFELANAPDGFAGAGQSLLLHSSPPVCITREVRRVDSEPPEGPPSQPRILFAAAAPVSQVPIEAHLLALRQAIHPWMRYCKDDEERRKRVAEHLTVLPQATLREIEEQCAAGKYTHVHILAHGVPVKKGDDRRFGLALHHSSRRELEDIVSGARLAKALRAPVRRPDAGFARPSVVTLAACDAGGLGSVVGAGASIAHALHGDGIPLVIASQLPLSFAGSVIMAQVLYEGFLEGIDPRSLLVNLRRRMKTQAPNSHDWASIVAYASFPPDLDQRVADFRLHQAFRRLEAALNHVDKMLQEKGTTANRERLKQQRNRVDAARDHLKQLLSDNLDAEVYGLVASAEKRLAQVFLRIKQLSRSKSDDEHSDIQERLISARKYYEKAFQRDSSQAWALVQILALNAVLELRQPEDVLSRDQWELARILSQQELRLSNGRKAAWSQANLMELYLLAPKVEGIDGRTARAMKEKARAAAEEFRKVTDLRWIEIHSTRRQLLRYPEFFAPMNPRLKALADEAKKLAGIIPKSKIYA
jgi:tetratricopeptide (TPR) repeat protein